MASIEIALNEHPPDEWRELVEQGVDGATAQETGVHDWQPIKLFVTNPAGDCLGGLLASVWGGWLHVTSLFVAEPLRGQGYGAALLSRAEEVAVQMGCIGSTLDTHSTQAKRLYEKAGYEVFAMLEDYPAGGAKYFLRKRISRS